MGCDIHLQVERKINGKWERVNELPPRPCAWCDGSGKVKGHSCFWCGELATIKGFESTPGIDRTPYCMRNYTVFSVIADVRNGRNVKPISEPRELPEDATHGEGRDEDGNDIATYEYGEHSFSWLLLSELLAYNWKQEIEDFGWVNAATFAKWDAAGAKGIPESWCGFVGGGGVEQITNAQMRKYISEGVREEYRYYTKIQWRALLSDYCKYFLSFLEILSTLGDPKDVRIVFGFDS